MAGLPGTSDQFNEPATNDTTSPQPLPQMPASPLAQALKRKNKKMKSPAPLSTAISRSKRAYQGGNKWGQP